jgi:ABC-type Fe3+-hydroxamate transport system substrate-binding protein
MVADVAADDLGLDVAIPGSVTAVVSLVPSLTEALAASDRRLVAGATKYCTHPAGLDVPRIGGTKNPDVDAIIALGPDLVLANEEENREPDLAALRAAGVAVWVTRIRDLPEALASLERMLTVACRLPRPGWLDRAATAWDEADAATAAAGPGSGGVSAVIPIWRRPWMVLGRDTFAGDLLARLGVANLYAARADRYPKVDLAALRASGADLIVLPDEPYRFTEQDGPEAFPGIPAALVSGRHLTWYGPSLAEAPAVLSRQLRVAG